MPGGHCTSCGAPVSGKFCGKCGAPTIGGPVAGRRPDGLWAAGGFALLAVLALVLMVVRQSRVAPPAPDASAASAGTDGTPPDISGLNSRERFDTLYNVIMRASESGDASRATRFMPMALAAYSQLEEVDADARYHAAVLRLHVEGDPKAALLLADTIQAGSPRHLFAFMIRGSAGQLAGDDRMVGKAGRDFLSAWDAEMASAKAEYRDHQIMLDQFRERALKSGSAGKP